MEREEVLFEATFNPKIKTYFFILGCLFGLFPILGQLFLIVWLLGFGSYFTKRYYNALACNLHPGLLHFKKGILFRVEKSIPLENIQDLTFKQGPLLRALGLSIFEIETAGGQSNRAGGDLTLVGIVDPEDFRSRVLKQREVLMNTKQGSREPAVQPTSDSTVLKEIADTLKRIEDKLGNS